LDDSGGAEMLCIACETLDRVQALREQTDEEGETVKVKGGGTRDNPLLRHELAGRAFISKCLTRLGLSVEATIRPVGRPAQGGLGVDEDYRRRLLNED
jgi:hypothetical protein